MEKLRSYLRERAKVLTENLRLWENGYLNPTEPDEQERECVKRELKAAIQEIRVLARYIPMWDVVDLLP